jgi:hypothetical protein
LIVEVEDIEGPAVTGGTTRTVKTTTALATPAMNAY